MPVKFGDPGLARDVFRQNTGNSLTAAMTIHLIYHTYMHTTASGLMTTKFRILIHSPAEHTCLCQIIFHLCFNYTKLDTAQLIIQ